MEDKSFNNFCRATFFHNINNHKDLLRGIIDFNLFDYLLVLSIKKEKNIDNDIALYEDAIKKVFSKKSIMFIYKLYKYILDNNIQDKNLIYDKIFNELLNKNTEDASIILFDLFIFFDIRNETKKRYPLIASMIDSYFVFDPNAMSSNIFNGSTVIGKLLNKEAYKEALIYFRNLLEKYNLNENNIKMIGGGGSSLVYKIGNDVLKIGETRNSRKIYINHRILASQIRKLLYDNNDNPLFYIEQMKCVRTDGITQKDVDELRQDLYEQGLIWDDAKIANCGILDPDDENICTLPVDYIEVAGKIDNPTRRSAFMKRKRRVVVIDNDNIRYNPLKTSG